MTKNNYILTESMFSTVAVYVILKKLMSNFDEWDAYKVGLIDKDGKKLKHPITSKEREAWDILTRFCWNLKKIISKFIGKSKMVASLSAAWLLKDSLSYFYLKHNELMLQESALSDITFKKQLDINNLIKELPTLNEKINQENIEFYIYKYYDIVESCAKKHNIFEDGEIATNTQANTSDIAQFARPLITKPQRRNNKPKKRRKRTFNENCR